MGGRHRGIGLIMEGLRDGYGWIKDGCGAEEGSDMKRYNSVLGYGCWSSVTEGHDWEEKNALRHE